MSKSVTARDKFFSALVLQVTNLVDYFLFLSPSTTPQPASVGINRMWVSARCRRKGVASKLLDSVR